MTQFTYVCVHIYIYVCICICRSQWPHGLRRRSTAARLLRLWVRIPPGHGCLSVVSVVCCQVEVSATHDHSSRGVLPTVMRRCVWSRNLKNEEAMARVGPQRYRNIYIYIYIYTHLFRVHFVLNYYSFFKVIDKRLANIWLWMINFKGRGRRWSWTVLR